jgi:hypothetical protein
MSLDQYHDDLDTWPNLFRANFRTLDQEEVDFWDIHVQRRYPDLMEGEISRAIQTMADGKADGKERFAWPTLEILLQTIKENRERSRAQKQHREMKGRRLEEEFRNEDKVYWKHGGMEPDLEDWREASHMMQEYHIKLFWPDLYEQFNEVEPAKEPEEDPNDPWVKVVRGFFPDETIKRIQKQRGCSHQWTHVGYETDGTRKRYERRRCPRCGKIELVRAGYVEDSGTPS